MVRLCILCERTDHYTGWARCPLVKPNFVNRRTDGSPLEAAVSNAEADDTSWFGATDRTMNRTAAWNRGRRPTPVYQTANQEVEELTSKTAVAAVDLASDHFTIPKNILRRTYSDPNPTASSGSSW